MLARTGQDEVPASYLRSCMGSRASGQRMSPELDRGPSWGQRQCGHLFTAIEATGSLMEERAWVMEGEEGPAERRPCTQEGGELLQGQARGVGAQELRDRRGLRLPGTQGDREGTWAQEGPQEWGGNDVGRKSHLNCSPTTITQFSLFFSIKPSVTSLKSPTHSPIQMYA